MKSIALAATAFATFLTSSLAQAEITQADINLVLPRFAGFWTYEGLCEKENVKNKNCWFILEIKKELYGEQKYFSYGMQKAIPAKTEVLKANCGDFSYNTGFTVSNLPDLGICIKLDDKNNKAELYYPPGMTEHGTYRLVRSTEGEWRKRTHEEDKESLKKANW